MKCENETEVNKEEIYLYELKSSLMTDNEKEYYKCIKEVIPEGYSVQPQVNLASFIVKKDHSRFQNELYRNVDFLIIDENFKPILIIEINDQTHFKHERKVRDEKVEKICEEAGIPLMKLWTSYGVNQEYIKSKVIEKINTPVERKHNFNNKMEETEPVPKEEKRFVIDSRLRKYLIGALILLTVPFWGKIISFIMNLFF